MILKTVNYNNQCPGNYPKDVLDEEVGKHKQNLNSTSGECKPYLGPHTTVSFHCTSIAFFKLFIKWKNKPSELKMETNLLHAPVCSDWPGIH